MKKSAAAVKSPKLKKSLKQAKQEPSEKLNPKIKSPEEKISIPPITLGVLTCTIIGDSPLLVHRFNEKSIKEIEEKQTGKAKAAKSFRNKDEEFKSSLYTMGNNKYGMPAAGIKNAMVTACGFIQGVTKTTARGAFHVIAGAGGLVEIKGKPVCDESIVRIGPFGKRVAIPRYRGRFDKWEVTFQIKFNKNVITPEQLLNLLENAGFAVGLCEWRPEKNGSMGMFSVKKGK